MVAPELRVCFESADNDQHWELIFMNIDHEQHYVDLNDNIVFMITIVLITKNNEITFPNVALILMTLMMV